MFRPLRLSGLQQLHAQQLERRGLHGSLVAAAGDDSDSGSDPSGRGLRGDERWPARRQGGFGRGRGGPPSAERSSGSAMGRQSGGPVQGGGGRGGVAGPVDGSRIRPQGRGTDHRGGQSAREHPHDAGSPHPDGGAQTLQGGTPRAPAREISSVGRDADPHGGERGRVEQSRAPLLEGWDILRDIQGLPVPSRRDPDRVESLRTREMAPGPSGSAPGQGAFQSPSAGAGRGRGARAARTDSGLPGMRTAQGVMQRPRQVWPDRPSPDQPRTDQQRPSAGRRAPAESGWATAAPDAARQSKGASASGSPDTGGLEVWDPSMFDGMFDEEPAIVTRPRLSRYPKSIEYWEEQHEKKRAIKNIDKEEKGPIFGRSRIFRESGDQAPKPRTLDQKKSKQFEKQIQDAEHRAKHYWDLLKAGESSKMKFYPLLDEIEALLPELPKTHWMRTYLRSSVRAIGENDKISNRDRGKFAMSMVRTLAAINDSLQSEKEGKP